MLLFSVRWCDSPSVPPNATPVSSHGPSASFSVGQSVRFRCLEGHTVSLTDEGEEEMETRCLEHGVWSRIEAACYREFLF